MSRFVVLSFLGLGFAFYELSGGADFEPPLRPVTPSPFAEAAPVASTSDVQPAPVVQASVVTAPTAPRTRPAEVTAQLQNAALVSDGKTRLTLATEGLQLASLEGGLAAGTVDVAAVAPEAAEDTLPRGRGGYPHRPGQPREHASGAEHHLSNPEPPARRRQGRGPAR